MRSIVLDLANQENRVLRKDAYSALLRISSKERGGLSLAEGKKRLADLAKAVRSLRFNRQYRDQRNHARGSRSSLADERARFANRLTWLLSERIRLHTREIIITSAKSIMPVWAIDGAGWLVYNADPSKRRHVGYEMTIEVSRRPDLDILSTKASHTIIVSQGWYRQIRRIGDGTGVVEGCLILSSRCVANTVSGELEILEVKFARFHERSIINGIAYISRGQNGKASIHQSFGQAYDSWHRITQLGHSVALSYIF